MHASSVRFRLVRVFTIVGLGPLFVSTKVTAIPVVYGPAAAASHKPTKAEVAVHDRLRAFANKKLKSGLPPELAPVYSEALAAMDEEKWTHAVELLDMVAEKRPEAAPVLVNRAVCHLILGHEPDAIFDLEHAATVEPSLRELVSGTLAEAYLRRGTIEAGHAESRVAREDLGKATEFKTTKARAFAQLAWLDLQDLDLNACLEHATRAIAIDGRLGDAYANRGACRFGLGHSREALADLTRAVTMAPESPKYRVSRAAIFRKVGDCINAIGDAEKAVRLDRSFAAEAEDAVAGCRNRRQ
jgi:tetratricopeptide (TPR) repeat protein